ncbi:MAG: efflux RND transporter periplasmic adaptor subunit [Chitinophagaceae bacterium]|nr:efflux RND transporter periplasmic adaptor subunit [Chitinophagaceae bacterium]MCA6454385.1 efflux RND transporter periplasmic adaptor subunit [Chitinophagaceae bacterium]MCA6456774.1 efflux RND transporter periplasmic adaptor subunit [Chitinophagaceae bacterium]MCA6458984.1 efflux RND transporter periplasmic adaptor subunit [Chitinophagaceae bacterium]MCA6465514.1 efflux RND transporter periplasmic adaptor subunit [Chitinophagaceae bacterium]
MHSRVLYVWILICTGVFFISCGTKKETNQSTPETFQVFQPIVIDTSYEKSYVADIHSMQNVEIRARVKGFIEKILVDEGKPVKAGQTLFVFNNLMLKEELLKANAHLKNAVAELKVAEVELKNVRNLVEKKVVSETELEMAKAKKEAIEAKILEAKAAVSIAELHISYSQIKAPFDGVINRIPYKVGSLVDEGTLLTTLSNNKEMFVYFNISEKEYLRFSKSNELTKQNSISLLLADNTRFKYKGRIETAETEIDKNTGNIAIRARFANPEYLLKHGATGKIILNGVLDNALVIPQKSTFEVQDRVNVFVVDSKNIVRTRPVEILWRLPHLYVVGAGLATGDKVIYEGVQLVKEGDSINAKPVDLHSLLPQLLSTH